MFKRVLIYFIVVLTLTSCSYISIEEAKQLADQSFEARDFTEFSRYYQVVLKQDTIEAERYLKKIKENEVFNIENYETETDLTNALLLFEEMKYEIDFLDDFLDEKSMEASDRIEYINYKSEISKILIKLTNQLDQHESPLSGIHKPSILMNSLESTKEILKEFEVSILVINEILIDLEDLKVIDDEKGKVERLIKSVDEYKKSLIEKENFIKENDVNIVVYTKGLIEGNIFAVTKEIELGGQIDKLTNNIKNAANDIRQRIKSLE